MTTVVVLGVIALIVAVLAWVTWRRGADERQSVQHHQHALETLRHVADRRQQSVSGRPGSPSKGPHRSDNGAAIGKRTAPASRRAAIPATSRNSGHVGADPDLARGAVPSRPARESAKVGAGRRETTAFADDVQGGRGGGSTAVSPSAARRMGGQLPGAAEQARRHGRTRVRRTRLVALAAVLAIAAAVGGVLASGRSPTPRRATSGATTHPPHLITGAGHGSPTTAPVAPRELTPTAVTAFSATYAAPAAAYTVAIDASAQCWVMATDSSTGRVVWTGTIAAGQSRALSVSGDLTVQLGAPTDASVTMNGQHAALPTGFRSPFSLAFRAPS